MRLGLRRGGPRDLAALAACLRVGEEICADLSSRDDPPAEIGSACAALSLADKPKLAAFAQQVGNALAASSRCRRAMAGLLRRGLIHRSMRRGR
jgi:DNA mismatch repair protein MutS